MNFVTNTHNISSEIVLISNAKQSEDCALSILANTFSGVIIIKSIDGLNTSLFIRAAIFDIDSHSSVDISWVRRSYPKTYIIIFQPNASTNPELRLQYFDAGANMVAHDVSSIINTLTTAVMNVGNNGGFYVCPYCDYHSLTEEEMWYHMPTFHINCKNESKRVQCPICQELTHDPLQVHIHENHGPKSHRNNHARTRLYSFSLVVCRHPTTGLYLLCQEFANQGFWLPGGAVDPGESLTAAARRETMEEAGVDVELKGILAIEHHPSFSASTKECFVRLRTIFYAEPTNLNQLPKSSPDFESAGACWCSYDQIIRGLKLRGREPLQWIRYVGILVYGKLVYTILDTYEYTCSGVKYRCMHIYLY